MEKLIRVENLSKNYASEGSSTSALRGVSFDVEMGEFLAIMGASGSGKSTLMHIIGFLDRPTDGKYIFDGKNANKFSDNELAAIRNEKIGFVFQSYNLLPRTSLWDNVLLPTIYMSRAKREKAEGRALKFLKRIGLGHRVSHWPNQLSGGEQQRAAIVRALINNPRLILADEPTGNLDSKSGQEVMEILQDLNREGHTIVMVTHEKEIGECAKRVLTLRDGQILSDEKVAKRRDASKGLVK